MRNELKPNKCAFCVAFTIAHIFLTISKELNWHRITLTKKSSRFKLSFIGTNWNFTKNILFKNRRLNSLLKKIHYVFSRICKMWFWKFKPSKCRYFCLFTIVTHHLNRFSCVQPALNGSHVYFVSLSTIRQHRILS